MHRVPRFLHNGTGKSLARLARRRHIVSQLRRAGGPQRVLAAVGRGVRYEDAIVRAAKICKGNTAELVQALEFTIASGVAGARERAVLSRNVSDPVSDLAIMRGTRAVHGGHRQIKVGSDRYVRDAIRKGKYAAAGVDLVANCEALAGLRERGLPEAADVADRVRHGSMAAPQLRADQSEAQAVRGLEQALMRRTTITRIGILVEAATSGIDDGLFTFVWNLAVAAFEGRVTRGGWLDIVRESAVRGATAYATTGVQTAIVLSQFNKAARAAYSAGLVRRVASTTLVAGAIAEVVVSAVIDMVKLLRGEIPKDEFLKRLVVTGVTAAGAAGGAFAASRLLADEPPAVRLLGMLAGTAGGGWLGRELGKRLTGR